MPDQDDPYQTPVTPSSVVGQERDKHVAGGCAIAAAGSFTLGVASLAIAARGLWLCCTNVSAGQPLFGSGLLPGVLIGLVGLCWTVAGILAYRMEQVGATMLFVTGVAILYGMSYLV